MQAVYGSMKAQRIVQCSHNILSTNIWPSSEIIWYIQVLWAITIIPLSNTQYTVGYSKQWRTPNLGISKRTVCTAKASDLINDHLLLYLGYFVNMHCSPCHWGSWTIINQFPLVWTSAQPVKDQNYGKSEGRQLKGCNLPSHIFWGSQPALQLLEYQCPSSSQNLKKEQNKQKTLSKLAPLDACKHVP